MNNISSIEKNIYNTHLRISRTQQGKPFKLRKDFSNLNDSDKLSTRRIGIMLERYPHIDCEDYITAPYIVYPNAEYFPLSFYANMGGINAYTVYMNQLQEEDPDSDRQLKFIIKSLKFIGSYCIKNEINYKEYTTYKIGVTYEWMKQIKKREISIYSLMDFEGINDIIYNTPEDERELFLGKAGKDFLFYKEKYLKSDKAIKLVKKGTELIKQINNT